MRFSSTALAVAASVSGANAASKGFNYGAFFGNNQAKVYTDFKYEFEAAKELPGTNGEFTSARLYTMIQHGTTNTVISAIQAAIDTNTELLLGIWASAGQTNVDNEITALKSAISQYGSSFANLVVGISVGSEDLYRITPTAIANGETNPGAQPSELVNYISQVRSAIAGTGLAGKPIGHVDTWTAYDNSSNADVINAIDFLGVDAYPYWEVQHDNSIGNANATFYDALQTTKNAAKGKPVWVTETGWPVSGSTEGQAVASSENAGIYWDDVTCSLISQGVNLWYYTLQDVQYSTPSPSFGIKPGGDLKAVSPLFDLSCPSSVKPVSYLLPFLLSSTLSPLYLLLLYNLSILSYLVSPLWSSEPCPPCKCNSRRKPAGSLVHPAQRDDRHFSWWQGLIGSAKSESVTPVPSGPETISRPTLPVTDTPTTPTPIVPTDSPTLTDFPTVSPSVASSQGSLPGSIWPPASATFTSSESTFPPNPTPEAPITWPQDIPQDISPPFIAPSLIAPIDSTDPDNTIGLAYSGKLSSTRSTLFAMDIPSAPDKTCNLVFILPPRFDPQYPAPYTMFSSGGISVSRFNDPAIVVASEASTSSASNIASIPQLLPGNKYLIESGPCVTEQRVGYRLDAINGLDLDFFQMSGPRAVGLFIEISSS